MSDPIWKHLYCPAIQGHTHAFVEKLEDGYQIFDCLNYSDAVHVCSRRWVPKMEECLIGKKVKQKKEKVKA